MSETAWRIKRKKNTTYLSDRTLGSIPLVSGDGGGGRLSAVPARLGLKRSHGLGDAGSESELLPQLHVGPTLG